jgi:putative hydrolase of the HAD superfamily
MDADDTLWENNVHFEEAVHGFIAFLDHSRLTTPEIRVVLDEVERLMGYGAVNFTKSLVETYCRLAEREVCETDLQRVREFGEAIRTRPLQLLAGVSETLEYLAARHDLLLLTKGDPEEQTLKIERSGLAGLFRELLIVPEKDVTTYQSLIGELSITPRHTWMVGNSPRSDINPALAAGLNAVFVPHPHTWHVEHEEIVEADGQRLLILDRFAELRNHF